MQISSDNYPSLITIARLNSRDDLRGNISLLKIQTIVCWVIESTTILLCDLFLL